MSSTAGRRRPRVAAADGPRPRPQRGPGLTTALSAQPHSLRDYAFLADGYRGALIGPRGDLGWMCAPRWDSPAVFSTLVGGAGRYTVTPVDTFVWGGYYEPGTLIWRSRWTTCSTRLECREALAVPAGPHQVTVLRRVEAIEADASVEIVWEPAADFGRARCTLRRDESGTWHASAGGLHMRWQGAAKATVLDRHTLLLRLTVPSGSSHDLVLDICDEPLDAPRPADALWAATEQAWRGWVPGFENAAGPRDARHAYAVLRGLTTPGGGLVAAATLGLPERAEAGRNYDYRYVWLRDQAFMGIAVGAAAPDPLMDEAVGVSTQRVLEHGDLLAPAYRVDGALPPPEQDLGLPGYPGGKVVVGNWVRRQFQLDTCGELLQLYATAARHDHLGSDDARAVSVLFDVVKRRWDQPEAGIWELEDAWWTQSRLSCVAGLRAVAAHLAARDGSRAVALADRILAETSRRCLGPDGGWQRSPTHPGTDAALLLPIARGALPADDPRARATVQAVGGGLVEDGYVYRYAVTDLPLGQDEGAFLLCGFVMCLAQLAAGDQIEAFRWFERQRAASGPAGLLSEEFDVQQRQLRGNLPQGFVHALLLECGVRLGEHSGKGMA